MLKRLSNVQKHLKIREKLILYFICLIAIPMTIIFVITYLRMSDIIKNKISKYGAVILREICNDIDELLVGTKELKYYVLPNGTLQKILSNTAVGYDEMNIDSNIMQNYMMDMINAKEYLTSVTFIGKNGYEYFYSKVPADTPNHLNDIRKSGLYTEVLEANGEMVWGGLDKEKNSYVVAMQLLSTVKLENIGVMVVNLDMNSIGEIFSKLKTETGGRFFVVDKNKEIIFHTDQALVGRKVNGELYEKIHSQGENLFTLRVDGIDSIIINYSSSEVGWDYIYTVPESEMMMEMIENRNILFLIFAGSVILAVVFAVRLSFGFTKPIKQLMNYMRRVEEGNFDVRVQVDSNDEIGQLGGKFNKMIAYIQNLINTVYKEGLMRKNAEFKALQAQINPHFLYNTLDSINSLAQLKGVDEISDITIAFSKLLRAAMSKDRSIISLKDELDYINNYMIIIQIRHNDRIKFILDIQEETLSCSLPKLLVQPLVENSVVHSFEGKDDECVIKVRSWIQDDLFWIQVEDNGIGMEDPLGQMNQQPHLGLGLSSVVKRIELLYGNEYGVNIVSDKFIGTTITLKLPKQIYEEKEELI